MAACVSCLAAPVKTSKFPWINTWGIEYYDTNATSLQHDVDHFDFHLGPHNPAGLKALAPNTMTVSYALFDTQIKEAEGDSDRRDMQTWAASHPGVDLEDFYCHFKEDVTVRGQNGASVFIPGWDPGNPKATAPNRAASRVYYYEWLNNFYPMNLANPNYQQFKADMYYNEIQANPAFDGFMPDTAIPPMKGPDVISGSGIITEYPDQRKWAPDFVALSTVIRQRMGMNRYVIGNTAGYYFPELADAGGGEHQEWYVAFTNEHGPDKWDYWKTQSDKGIYSFWEPSWDAYPADLGRARIHYLAFHYMGQQPYIYLGFRGFGYRDVWNWAPNEFDWFAACEANVGNAVDGLYKAAKSGSDPTGQSYTIYTRRYTNALIVCRPKINWNHDNYGDNTGVAFALPSYTTSSGATSNQYKPLRVDGTLGSAVTQVTLRQPESAILFMVDAGTPNPGDVTPPVISGLSAVNVSGTGATITWSTDEASTSVVDYGPTSAYGSTSTASGMATGHSVVLNGLSAGVTYHCRVKSADAAGNTAMSADYTFTTGSPNPVPTGAFLRDWLVIGAFDNASRAGYGTDYIGETTVTPSTGSETAGQTWNAVQSSNDLIDLGGLFSDTDNKVAYAHLYVNSATEQTCYLWLGTDDGVKAWINGTLVQDNPAERPASPDTDSVLITLKQGWNRILLKVDNLYGGWGFYARLGDSQGNSVSGLSYSLDDQSSPDDTTPPDISSVASSNVTQTSATITWTTDEDSTSAVDYGTTTAYGSTANGSDSVSSHSVSLSNLIAGTTYHYRVKSDDAAGNTATGSDYTFTTLSVPQPPPPTPSASTFIRSWLLLATFDNISRTAFKTDLIGENLIAPSVDQISSGKRWRAYTSPWDQVDFLTRYTTTDYKAAYAHIYVYSPVAQSAQLWTGSDDGIKAWVNGSTVLNKAAVRPTLADQDKTPISLKMGWNRLLLKIDNLAGGWGFCARICDAYGNMLPDIAYQLDNPAPGPDDVTPPTVTKAVAVDAYTVQVYFNEVVNKSIAQVASYYKLSPSVTITKATLGNTGKMVTLKTSTMPRGTYKVTVTKVADVAGNAIPITGAVGNTAIFTY
ncbi:MAG: fibronectin type III domain-containing protein [Armatimonadetes bacterium]|nr:fibronectin type III domain-containing protein [Armatimonadota bacterium]